MCGREKGLVPFLTGSVSSISSQQSLSCGQPGCISPVDSVQLAQNAANVAFNRMQADRQLIGNKLVGGASCEQIEYISFPCRKVRFIFTIR